MTSRGQWALQIAKEAGEFTLRRFDNPALEVDRKQDGTPVTAVDREAADHRHSGGLRRAEPFDRQLHLPSGKYLYARPTAGTLRSEK